MRFTFTIPALIVVASASPQPLTLERALGLAMANRPSIRSTTLNVERARLEARALGIHPGLTVGIGQSSREALGATDQDFFASQQIDIFGRTSAWRRVGLARLELAEADRRSTLLSVQDEVLQAFFAAATADRLRMVAEDLLGLAVTLHKATVRRYEEGKVPEVQVKRATIELDRARQSAALRKSQFQAAIKRLTGAVGTPLPADTVDANSILGQPQIRLEDRPDILAFAAQVQVARAEGGVASRSNLPELEVVGLRTPWREPGAAYGARIQLSWRIVDFGKSRHEKDAANKLAESAQAALLDATKRAQAEILAIDIEIDAASERVKSYEAIRTAALDLVDKSQLGYSEGFSNLLDVLEASRALREVEQELAEAQLAFNLAMTAKYRAAGTLVEVTK